MAQRPWTNQGRPTSPLLFCCHFLLVPTLSFSLCFFSNIPCLFSPLALLLFNIHLRWVFFHALSLQFIPYVYVYAYSSHKKLLPKSVFVFHVLALFLVFSAVRLFFSTAFKPSLPDLHKHKHQFSLHLVSFPLHQGARKTGLWLLFVNRTKTAG